MLQHEQGHFDIAEVFARMMRKEMAEMDLGDCKKLDLRIKKRYNKVFNKMQEMQELYDFETEHSQNRTEQIIWLNHIKQLLEKYSDYRNQNVVLYHH